MWQNISNVNSCYDFKSKTACETFGPYLTDDIGTCKWNEHPVLKDLGYGVCAPLEYKKQNCTKCNEKTTGIDACSYEQCQLYGACYYTERGKRNFQCLKKEDVRCEDFKTIEDCINSNSIYSQPE